MTKGAAAIIVSMNSYSQSMNLLINEIEQNRMFSVITPGKVDHKKKQLGITLNTEILTENEFKEEVLKLCSALKADAISTMKIQSREHGGLSKVGNAMIGRSELLVKLVVEIHSSQDLKTIWLQELDYDVTGGFVACLMNYRLSKLKSL